MEMKEDLPFEPDEPRMRPATEPVFQSEEEKTEYFMRIVRIMAEKEAGKFKRDFTRDNA